MNASIELHDSTVSEIAQRGGEVVVHFRPAYLHKSEGEPGVDAGTGWVQEARLIFAEASADGNFPELPCSLLDGELMIGEVLHDNMVPVPFQATGLAELRLVFDSLYKVKVTGQGVRLELLGEPRYVEEFAP